MDVLKQLQAANKKRCIEFGKGLPIEGWTPTDWACALAGETGELCNIIKKLHRGDQVNIEDIADEAGDIVTYLDLLCQRLGVDLQTAIVNKFNKKSDQIGSAIKIYYY